MTTVSQVIAELKKKGNDQTRRTLLRHGAPEDTYGVKIADLKVIAKKIKGQQDLALELFESGNYDAMYLAGIVADGMQMTKRQLQSWAKGAKAATLAEYTVPGVAAESSHARDLAMKWIDAKSESVASTGWCTYSGYISITPDEELDLNEIQQLLNRVVAEIHEAPNHVRSTMNSFVISVGTYVKPLFRQAKAAAKKIGTVSVDMGDTACKVPVATAYIAKVETLGRVGKKRKSAKC